MKILKLIIINLVVIFVLLEGGMRLYYASSDKVPPHSDHSVVREWRWVQPRLNQDTVSFDSRFVHDPYAGWKNAPNIQIPATPSHGAIRTNAAGLRNVKDFEISESPDRPRILIVGDSYSFGHGISNEDTYSHQLDKLIPDWDVLNMAVSATGTDQNQIMFEHYGTRYKPRIVLLGFYLLDFNRNTFSFRDYAKPMYLPQEDGSLTLTHSPVPTPQALLDQYKSGEKQIGGWHYSYAVAAFQKVITTAIKRNRREGSLPRRTLSGIMEKFAEQVKATGATPVWVIFPIRDILEKESSKYEVIGEFAESEAKRIGMPVLNLDPVFRQYLQDNPDIKTLWRPREVGGHLTALGNRITASAILKLLNENQLLPDPALVPPPIQ